MLSQHLKPLGSRGGSSNGTRVYTCIADNFCKKLQVRKHQTAKSLEVRVWELGFAHQQTWN